MSWYIWYMINIYDKLWHVMDNGATHFRVLGTGNWHLQVWGIIVLSSVNQDIHPQCQVLNKQLLPKLSSTCI